MSLNTFTILGIWIYIQVLIKVVVGKSFSTHTTTTTTTTTTVADINVKLENYDERSADSNIKTDSKLKILDQFTHYLKSIAKTGFISGVTAPYTARIVPFLWRRQLSLIKLTREVSGHLGQFY
uniref:Uncharacterized protein n=1 Tax=Glossina pallidipes TaxID=7398 RepID=A0A1B0A238_GLOPL